MATIIRQERKKGVNYRIQVSVKDNATGKFKTITTTWTPEGYMSKYEQEKAAKKFADEYEDKVRDEQNNPLNINSHTTLSEYSNVFLEQIAKHTSKNYYSRCKLSMKFILPSLGNYKLMEIKPLVVQNFIDSLPRLTYTVHTVKGKPKLNSILKARNLSSESLSRMSGVNASTVKVGRAGNNISMESAKKMAKALNMQVSELFNVESVTQNYSSQTMSSVVAILKHMLSMAKRFDVIDKNYASPDYVKNITATPKETEVMDLDDTMKALKCIKKDPDIRAVTAVMIGIYMGRRRGEVAGLMWPDINLKTGEMTVVRSRTVVAGFGVDEKEPKTKYSAKTYAMPQTLTKQLIRYKEWWDDFVENYVGDKYKEPYLFLQDNGSPIYPTTIYRWWKNLQEKYKLKSVHYHSLRKTNISVQYASNLIPSQVIAERAGHANDKVTKEKYLKVFRKDDFKTAQIVDSIFARN